MTNAIPEGRPRPPALPIGPSSASASDTPVVRRRSASSAPTSSAPGRSGSLLDQTAHLFAERSTAPTIRRLVAGTSSSSTSSTSTSSSTSQHHDAPAVPASASGSEATSPGAAGALRYLAIDTLSMWEAR